MAGLQYLCRNGFKALKLAGKKRKHSSYIQDGISEVLYTSGPSTSVYLQLMMSATSDDESALADVG